MRMTGTPPLQVVVQIVLLVLKLGTPSSLSSTCLSYRSKAFGVYIRKVLVCGVFVIEARGRWLTHL
jgi:hypothetical protein